jgi:hypothetical protein
MQATRRNASQRGVVDLVVMIVMIVLLLGLGTMAFIQYDRAQKEKQVLTAMQDIPIRQRSEIEAARARYAEVCNYIGFKGGADYSSPAAISQMLEDGTKVIVDSYTVPKLDTRLSGTEGDELTIRRLKDGQWVEEKVRTSRLKQTTRSTDPMYREAEGKEMLFALGRQDQLINKLFTEMIPLIKDHRMQQRASRETAAGTRENEAQAKYETAKQDSYNSDNTVRSRHTELGSREDELAAAALEANAALLALDNADVRKAREEAFMKAREVAEARVKAIDMQDAYRSQADKYRTDDTRDPDGFVFLVDEVSGYCWINIGQSQDVRLNQTFSVLRADASRDSEVSIGEVRVVEVMRGNIARCRVDALNDPTMYPASGDIIRNPNFTARQFETWALVGKFGGEYSKVTRQELVDLLRGVGLRVVNQIDPTVDAVVIGGDWQKDEEYIMATSGPADDPDKGMKLNFERISVEEVLYFLGITGPDRKR